MTPNVRRLLLIVGVLLVLQWIVTPIVMWQNHLVAELEAGLATLTKRNSTIKSVEYLDSELSRRQDALTELSDLTFPLSPTDTLDIQRWVEKSLGDYDLTLSEIEWGPKSDGYPVTVRAKVVVRGRFIDTLIWQTAIQLSEPWVTMISMQSSRNTRRGTNTQIFSSTLSLQFLLAETAP